MWARAGLLPTWIHEECCYHEATAIVRQGDMAIWDPTESRWVESDAALRQVYAGLVTIRVGSDQFPAGAVIWAGQVLPLGEWVEFSEEQRHAEPGAAVDAAPRAGPRC